jgi:NADPH:quinone reductase-like Zn-dependent oxidoreductase
VLRERFPSVPVISTSDPSWAGKARAALGGPAGVIRDPVGGTLAAQLLGQLEDGGTLISYGALSGEGLPLGPGTVMGRELRVRGVTIGRWASARTARQRAGDIEFAVELASTTPELLDIAAVYDLADYPAAVTEVTRPGKIGTVVLTSPLTAAEGGA